jgi:hypothetical protein
LGNSARPAPWWNTAVSCDCGPGEPALRYPIIGIGGGRARAASGHAAVAPPSRATTPTLAKSPYPAALPSYYSPRRFRALALFSRRPPKRVVRWSSPAAENLHNCGLMHCSKESPYSITSSARCWRVQGTSRPSAFAVFMLITSSNLTGNCMGSSLGFSPLKTRSA